MFREKFKIFITRIYVVDHKQLVEHNYGDFNKKPNILLFRQRTANASTRLHIITKYFRSSFRYSKKVIYLKEYKFLTYFRKKI